MKKKYEKYRDLMAQTSDNANAPEAAANAPAGAGTSTPYPSADTNAQYTSSVNTAANAYGQYNTTPAESQPSPGASSTPSAQTPAAAEGAAKDRKSDSRRRRKRKGDENAETGPVKPAEAGLIDNAAGGYKAYGEPLDTNGQNKAEFSELEAMEELLAAESDYGALPHPEIFNAYPPEVQRKIMEWTDRDVKARRDDESRRKDELVRATIERERRKQSIPAIIIVIAVLCGAIVGFATGNPWFSVAFLVVPIAVIVAVFVSDNIQKNRGDRFRKPPKS